MSAKRRPPSGPAVDFSNWIGNHAKREGLAVMAIIWDRQPGSPALFVVEGADQHVPEDQMGGFKRRVSQAILSQADLRDALIENAMEIAVFGTSVDPVPMPRKGEH